MRHHYLKDRGEAHWGVSHSTLISTLGDTPADRATKNFVLVRIQDDIGENKGYAHTTPRVGKAMNLAASLAAAALYTMTEPSTSFQETNATTASLPIPVVTSALASSTTR